MVLPGAHHVPMKIFCYCEKDAGMSPGTPGQGCRGPQVSENHELQEFDRFVFGSSSLFRPASSASRAHVADRTLSTHSSPIQLLPVHPPEKRHPPPVPRSQFLRVSDAFTWLSLFGGYLLMWGIYHKMLQGGGVEGFRVVILSWAALQEGAN